jgi:redox-regulated HSP33 family molecular chaperone
MMEQAQLFKRLLAITDDEISSFINHDEEVNSALMRLELAARTRHIIDAIQLEDMWQELNEESQTFNIHLAMKLSPNTLCARLDFEEEMNCLEWRIVLPKYSDIDDQSKPSCIGDYLAMMKQLEIVDVNEYDIDLTCTYLDQVYDFTPHKQKNWIPFNRLGR